MRQLSCLKVFICLMISTFLSAQTFRIGNPTVGNPQSSGWKVDPGLGTMSLSLPLGAVPGEIPIPVSLTMNGSFQNYELLQGSSWQTFRQPVFGTCGFGYLVQIMSESGTIAWDFTLENGSILTQAEFSNQTEGSALLSSWGFPTLSYQVNSDGTLLWTRETLSQSPLLSVKSGNSTIQPNLPIGFSLPSQITYDLVADKNLIRVFVEVQINGLTVGVPILWADRFGHSVTFQWTQVNTGLPTGLNSIVRVDALNQRGQGLTIRCANWSDSTSFHDLMRTDFVNFSGPSALVQGYSGASTNAPYYAQVFPGWQYNIPSTVGGNIPGAVGGVMVRPTSVILGDPLTIGQPSWNNDGAPAGSSPLLPSNNSGISSLSWQFNYDTNIAELISFTDPWWVTTEFTYNNYSLLSPSPNLSSVCFRGVSETVETDNSQSSPQVRTKTWTRSLPSSSSSAWTVTAQDYWSSIGRSDSTVCYTYAPNSNNLDYSNEFLQQVVLEDTAGNAWSTVAYSSMTTAGTSGGGLDHTLSIPKNVNITRKGENIKQVNFAYTDSTDLQASSVIDQVTVGGTETTFQTIQTTYNNVWSMLESQQANAVQVTRNAFYSGTSIPKTTSNVWDSSNLLELQKSFLSGSSSYQHGKVYQYDAQGRVITQGIWHLENGTNTSPLAQTVSYDGGTSLTTGTGQPCSWQTQYTDFNISGGSINSTLTRTANTFDAGDRATVLTDEKQIQTTLAYDLLGRVTSSTTQGTATVSMTYPDQWTVVKTQAGVQTTEYRDGFGRLIKEILPSGAYFKYAYDLHGRQSSITKTSSPSITEMGFVNGSVTSSTSYDLLDRPTTQTGLDGSVISTSYAADNSGCNMVTRAFGASPNTFYPTITLVDPFGQTSKVTAPSGDVTQNTFDSWGHLTQVQVTSANSGAKQIRTFTYTDPLGRLTSKTEPETGTQTFSQWNALNQANYIVEASTRSRTLVMDGLGRLRGVTASIGTATASQAFFYSGPFLMSASDTVGSATVSQTFQYNPAAIGAQLRQEITNQAGLSTEIDYTYNNSDLGELASITYPSGRVVTYGYDNLARATSITSSLGGTVENIIPTGNGLVFDGCGYRASLIFQTGSQGSWSFDCIGRPLSWRVTSPPAEQSGQLWLYQYQNMTARLSDTREWSLQCDSNGRLTNAIENWGLSGSGNLSQTTTNLVTNALTPDAFGNNVVSSFTTPGTLPATLNPFNFANFMTVNQLPGLTSSGGYVNACYTPFGELDQVNAIVSGQTILFGWDALGRLAVVDQTQTGATESYSYAPSGLRVARVDSQNANLTRYYAYSSGGNLLCEYVLSANQSIVWNRDVIYLDGHAVAEIDGSAVHEMFYDHLGTPRIFINESTDAVEGTQTFGPYGEYLYGTGYVPLTGYTGHIQTEPNGLIYMRGRFYSPAWHVFLNSDQGADPNSWNQYAYAGGNPLVNSDPSGMFSWHGINPFDPLHVDHATSMAWRHLRGPVELVAVAVASYYTCGAVSSWVGGGILGGMAGGATAGAEAGYAMNGNLRGAEMGALSGAIFGGVNAYCQDAGMGPFAKGLTNSFVAGAYSQACGGSFSKGFIAEAELYAASACFQNLVGSPANPTPGTDRTYGVDNAYDTENGIIPQEWRDQNYNVIGLNSPTGNFAQSGLVSDVLNLIPGMNAVAQFHDTMFLEGGYNIKFDSYTNFPCMIPAAIISYGAIKYQLGYGVH